MHFARKLFSHLACIATRLLSVWLTLLFQEKNEEMRHIYYSFTLPLYPVLLGA